MHVTKEKYKNKKVRKIKNKNLTYVEKEQIVDKMSDEELEKVLWRLEQMEILTGRF